MPIAQINGLSVFFAHVPKCAGSSIEVYLNRRFGRLAFHDRKYLSQPEDQRWCKTSPQHIPARALARLFPEGFFAHTFAMVRHPVERLRSVYLFQQEIEGTIAPECSFDSWVETLPQLCDQRPQLYDGHIQPMHSFVPPQATIFRLEEGEGPLIRWLDQLAGNRDDTDSLPRRKVRADKATTPPPPISDVTRARLEALYAKDMKRFGYHTKETL